MPSKPKLKKATIRFYENDLALIQHFFPGGSYHEHGINGVIREVIHAWVERELQPRMQETLHDQSTDNSRPQPD